MNTEQMSIKEKLAMLCEAKKAYILGFIDGVLSESKKNAQKSKDSKPKAGTTKVEEDR